MLAFILVLAVKGYSNPFMAVMAFAAAYELQPGELYAPLAYLHIERVLLAYILLLLFMKQSKFKTPPITRRFLWFYGAILLSTVFAFWRSNSIEFDFSFLEIVLYHVLLVCVLNSEERIRDYLLMFTGLMAWIGASSLYEYHEGVRFVAMNIERAQGLTSAGGDADSMAITMVITMPLALIFLSKGTSKRVKLYGVALFAVFLTTIIDTGSRNAFLGFLVFLMLATFHKRRNWKYLPLVLVALPLLWLVIPQQYKTRYETIETRDQDESYTNRLLSWQGGVKMFLHNPATGIGPDNYTVANGMEYWPGQPRHWLNAHSLYFKLLGELGVIGVFTFFSYLLAVIRTNWFLTRRFGKDVKDPIVRQFPRACNLCLCLLLFTGYAAHNTYRSNWYTLGAITAAIALLKREPVHEETGAESPKRIPAWVPRKRPAEPETAKV